MFQFFQNFQKHNSIFSAFQWEYMYRGKYGKFEVEGLVLGNNDSDRTKIYPLRSTINFGTIKVDNSHCRLYVMMYDEWKLYRQRTRYNIPHVVGIR